MRRNNVELNISKKACCSRIVYPFNQTIQCTIGFLLYISQLMLPLLSQSVNFCSFLRLVFSVAKYLRFTILQNVLGGIKMRTWSSIWQNISLAPFKSKYVSYRLRLSLIRYTSNWLVTDIVGRYYQYTGDSLSQSLGDQTKYFEISVVRDSQSLMSFTFFMYMYVELHIACTCIIQLCKYPPEGYQ